jgi:hypothetical protein
VVDIELRTDPYGSSKPYSSLLRLHHLYDDDLISYNCSKYRNLDETWCEKIDKQWINNWKLEQTEKTIRFYKVVENFEYELSKQY